MDGTGTDLENMARARRLHRGRPRGPLVGFPGVRRARLVDPHPLGPASRDAALRRSSARRLAGAKALQANQRPNPR